MALHCILERAAESKIDVAGQIWLIVQSRRGIWIFFIWIFIGTFSFGTLSSLVCQYWDISFIFTYHFYFSIPSLKGLYRFFAFSIFIGIIPHW